MVTVRSGAEVDRSHHSPKSSKKGESACLLLSDVCIGCWNFAATWFMNLERKKQELSRIQKLFPLVSECIVISSCVLAVLIPL